MMSLANLAASARRVAVAPPHAVAPAAPMTSSTQASITQMPPTTAPAPTSSPPTTTTMVSQDPPLSVTPQPPVPNPTAPPVGDTGGIGAPGPGGAPAPAGYTWVSGATVNGQWVPGHWARLGTTTTGTSTTRDHTTAAPPDPTAPTQLDQSILEDYSKVLAIVKRLGGTDVEAHALYTTPGTWSNMPLTPTEATSAKAQQISPTEFAIKKALLAYRNAVATGTSPADGTIIVKPPDPTAVPKPTTTPLPVATSSSTRTIIAVALAMAAAFILLGCQESSVPFVEKRIMPMPFVRTVSPQQNSAGGASTPSTDAAYFGGSLILQDATGQNSDSQTYVPGTNTLAQNALRVSLSSSTNDPLQAITLAPDSPYPEFYVWTVVDGTLQARACNIENPVMGFDRANPDIFVTVPSILPAFAVTTTMRVAWDAMIIRDPAGVLDVRVWPLKMYLWYGMQPNYTPTKRAPLYARVRVNFSALRAASFLVPVLGRRTVTARWLNSQPASTLALNTYYNFQAGSVTQSDQQANAQAVAPTAESAEGEIQLTSPKLDGATVVELLHTTGAGGDIAPGTELHVIGYD